MSTTRRGISDHKMVENFEKFRKRLCEEFGFTEAESIRGAAALTALSSPACKTREQAWEAADDVSKLIPHTPNPRGNDGK